MWSLKVVERRAQWDDAGGVHVALAIIARLDLIKIRGVLDARPLIKLTQIVSKIRIVLKATLERPKWRV